jgi:predicted MPP superfamily phosphohydrolase
VARERALPLAAAAAPPRGHALVLGAVALVLAILALCWTSVGLLLAPVVPGHGRTIVAAALLLGALPFATLVTVMTRGLYPGTAVRLFVFRPFWYAQFTVLFLTIVGLAAALAGSPFGHAAEAGRGAILVAGALFVVMFVAGYFGSRTLEVRRFVAALPGLPPALEGLRLVQLSDLHVGPHTPRRHLEAVLRAVRDAQPELIAVTGDLVDDYPGDVECYREAFGSLSAPLGVYAIPGNHEIYTGWEKMRSHLERLPLTLLVNRSAVVERGGGRFAVVGTGDPAGGDSDAGPDLDAAFAGVAPGAFVLALAHNPALWPALVARGVPFTLSGHTHWGQLAIPRWNWCLASPFLEFAMGSHARGVSLLYIHPGSNYWGLPFRIGTPSQVALITLRRGAEPAFADEGAAADRRRDQAAGAGRARAAAS